MTLQEIKIQVASFFPGKAQAWINGKVKEMTQGDLRKKVTWEYALTLMKANQVEPITSLNVTEYSDEIIANAAEMLYNLPDKIKATPVPDPVSKPSQSRIDPVDVAIAADMLRNLPQREIKPNVFIVGRVEGAKPLAA